MPEIAVPAGLLVDLLVALSIADGLLRLAQDLPLRTKLAEAARTQALRYCWGRAAEATLTVLLEAARRSTSSRN